MSDKHKQILKDLAQYVRHFSPLETSLDWYAPAGKGQILEVSWFTNSAEDSRRLHNLPERRSIGIAGAKIHVCHPGDLRPDVIFPLADPEYRKKVLLFLCKISRKKPYSNLRP